MLCAAFLAAGLGIGFLAGWSYADHSKHMKALRELEARQRRVDSAGDP
jgi:hypothetical protein